MMEEREERLAPELAVRLADLYGRMEEAYEIVARQLDFTCDACPDNCCDSYFQHHTRIEWAYLRQGLAALPLERRKAIENRAADCAAACEEALSQGERPMVMCPLNEGGRCALYVHRLMICRMHGVPASLTFPNGRMEKFPGCFRCQERTAGQPATPAIERAPLLRELAALEQEFLAGAQLPRVKKTIAEMIILGPPRVG